MQGEPAKNENPLTSVRDRGHSSHLVCRTSGFLLLCPPPPSPPRLHGGFLFLPLQKAMAPKWHAKGWQLECFWALSFTLTLILLLTLSSARYVYPCLPASLSFLIPPLPFNFSPSYFQSISFHTRSLRNGFLHTSSVAYFPLPFFLQPSFVSFIVPS